MHQKLHGVDAPAASRHTPAQTRAALRQLADSARMIVWKTDVNDFCTYLSKSARALFKGFGEVHLSGWLQFIHPDDLPTVCARRAQAREAEDEYQIEYRILRSDGTVRWMLDSAAPRFTDTGEFDGYSGSTLDVSKQHEAFELLTRSEAEYRLLAENTSDLICHCAPDGTYLYVSPSYRRQLGMEPSTMLGRSAYDFLHPDDLQLVRDEVYRQLETDAESHVIEIRKRHQDGHYVWMGSKIQVMVDPVTRQKTGTVSISRDITLERRERDERRKSEERFRSLTQLSSDWYWETETEDRFVFVSDRKHRVRSLPSEDELIGKRRVDFVADPTHPEVLAYHRKIANRESFRNLPLSCRNLATGHDYHVSISGEPVYEEGVFTGYRGVGRDVTAEKEMLRQLARLADENNALVENSPDIMMLFDGADRILRANRVVKDILGYEPEELVGRHFLEMVTPDMREQTRDIAEKHIGEDVIPTFENCWHRKDGSIVHLSWAGRRSLDKTVTYATARDVSDAHLTRSELHRINQRLNTILESIGDAFFSVDRDWRVTYGNLKMAEFIGVDREEAIGKRIWEILPDVVHSSRFAHYQHAMQTGESRFVEEYYEPAGIWVNVRIYPHEDGLSIFFHDISKRREAERAIRESEERFREMIAITPAGYVATDARGIVLDVNPALCEMSGYARAELIGQDVMQFLPDCPMGGAIKTKGGACFAHGKEMVIRHKQGHSVYALVNLTIKCDAEGNALSLTAFVTDITERKQVENQLERLATHDMLTGLPNRVLINRRLQAMLDTARANDAIAVMFIDLDRFKEVNDSMGHAPGDILLRQVALRLQKNMRPNDIVARLGGDEFVVAAPCSGGKASAARIAEKLVAELSQPFEIDAQEVFISASIGISMYPEDARTKEILFQNADTAMYRAKTDGRGKYRFFETEMTVEAKMRMTLEHSLRYALERGEFELHYQPRIDLKTMHVVGMEALIRWNHPQLGRIAPAQFIPIAEDKGLIAPIGQWVLQEACRQTKALTDRFARPLHVSVNLSAHQLKCQDLIEQVIEALSQADLPPSLLELELTESALIEDVDHSVHVLRRLKHFGIMLSVDDFGTGYSGLSYLKRFPVDILKLDRSFVHQQPEGVSSLEFIKAFVDMAHALKLSVVAEGIETWEILQLLTDSRCDAGQGYLFARPMPLEEFEEFLMELDHRPG